MIKKFKQALWVSILWWFFCWEKYRRIKKQEPHSWRKLWKAKLTWLFHLKWRILHRSGIHGCHQCRKLLRKLKHTKSCFIFSKVYTDKENWHSCVIRPKGFFMSPMALQRGGLHGSQGQLSMFSKGSQFNSCLPKTTRFWTFTEKHRGHTKHKKIASFQNFTMCMPFYVEGLTQSNRIHQSCNVVRHRYCTNVTVNIKISLPVKWRLTSPKEHKRSLPNYFG